MGVKERKTREKTELRERILQTAHQLFVNKGFAEVSIRNIAEEIEYSPATIYLYFKDKDDIFYALHQEAFKFFNEFISEMLKIKDPFKRLIKLGERYIEFGRQYPHYYTIMFLTESPMHNYDDSEMWQEGCKSHAFLEEIVAECIKEGHFKGYDHRVLAFTIWSYVHGMCALELRQRMKIYDEKERDKMIDKSFKMFKHMMEQL